MMLFPPRFLCRRVGWLVLGACWLLVARSALAQQQDRKLFDRIMNPDLGLRAEGFDHAYTPPASKVSKTATMKTFAFSHAATTRAGDGAFRTQNFTGTRDGLQNGTYATKGASFNQSGSAPADRVFDTKTAAVREDRAAGKSARLQTYQTADKPFLYRGHRQDEMDELRRRKNLDIDEVRELLNKNR